MNWPNRLSILRIALVPLVVLMAYVDTPWSYGVALALFVLGGVVSYDPRVKHEVLGVTREVIDTVGVVSEPCARQMAEGARRVLKVDIAVSATGVAGPTGGTPETPVGTVFIGVSGPEGTRVEECHFGGDRAQVRAQSAAHALGMALEALEQHKESED